MSDNIKDVEIIPFEVTIDLKVSGEFYARYNQFVMEYFPYESQEHFAEVIKHVKEDTNQDDPFVYKLKTLLALQVYIEQSAREQKKTKMIKYDTENNKVIEEESQSAPQDPEQTESPN
jgi:hypothetical protein